MLEFEWDKKKAKSNLDKHGVSFDEAVSAFFDDFARVKPDSDHSLGEERWILMGYSYNNKLLTISFSDRNGSVRIISARKSTKSERKQYEEFK